MCQALYILCSLFLCVYIGTYDFIDVQTLGSRCLEQWVLNM